MGEKRKKNKINKKKIQSILAGLFQGVSFYFLLVAIIASMVFVLRVYSQEKEVQLFTGESKNVEEGSKVVLRFSTKMLKKTVQEGLVVRPSIAYSSFWNSEKELVLVPEEDLRPESKYTIEIQGAKSKWRISQTDFKTSFTTPALPKVRRVYPVNGQEDIEYQERIMIEFDKPLHEENVVKVAINPLSGFDYDFNDGKTQLIVAPKEQLKEDTEYSLAINLKDQNFEDVDEQLYEGTFKTKPLPIVVYNLDQNGEPLKTEERKEKIEPQIAEGKYVDIDISSQTLVIFEDGREKGAYKVSTGIRGMDTPSGTFKVIAKSRRPWSAKYKLYMPWFIQFTYEGHGIHELPEWPGGYKEGASHLGIPVSHGCVRLGIGPAKIVYDFVEPGTPVVIHQ